jgi:hypothetical protein
LAHREIFEDHAESSEGPATQLLADFEAKAVEKDRLAHTADNEIGDWQAEYRREMALHAVTRSALADERERVRVLTEASRENLISARIIKADSEARAVSAATKHLEAQMNYATALQRAIEHYAQGIEIPATISNHCPHHASMLNHALTAEHERSKVLRQALESLAYWHGNTLETRITLRNRIATALAATAQEATL